MFMKEHHHHHLRNHHRRRRRRRRRYADTGTSMLNVLFIHAMILINVCSTEKCCFLLTKLV